MAEISIASSSQQWSQNVGIDPARYLVNPGKVTIGNKHKPSPGNLYHARPYIVSGSNIFVFPVGVEGFTRSGQAQLGLHHYIGGNAVDGVTVHYEEARIELTGTFPGITAQDAMVDCIGLLRSQPPDPGLVLYAPGVFEREQYCLPENWNFTHDPDDRTHSISYTISLVRIGEGRAVADPHGKPAPKNPTIKVRPKGKPARIFTVKDGVRTFRAIAKKVYGNQNKWHQLVELNRGELANWQRSTAINKAHGLPTFQLPTFRWPVGTKFRY